MKWHSDFWQRFPELTAAALAMKARGMTASNIARALKKDYGAEPSRNAVIGRLYRLRKRRKRGVQKVAA